MLTASFVVLCSRVHMQHLGHPIVGKNLSLWLKVHQKKIHNVVIRNVVHRGCDLCTGP